MPKFSVRKPFTIFVIAIIIILLGIISFKKLTTDLLPEFSLPYVVVITTYPGASPDKVESELTETLESGLGTVNGVENVTSTSAENYSMVMLEFDEDTDMDSAMVDLSTALDTLTLPDSAGTPMLMEVSMDMIPVMYASVDYEDMDIYELSEFVEEEVVSKLERVDGVASVDVTGSIEQTVEIRLDQDKIDALNDELAAYVNDELADAKEEIDDAEEELADAKAELADAKAELETSQDDLDEQEASTSEELGETSALVDQAAATQAAYEASLTTLQASKSALEAEMSVYEEAGIESSYKEINETFASMQTMLAAYGLDASAYPSDIADAIENTDKLDNLVAYLTQIGQEESAAELTVDNLTQIYEIVNTRIPQIETELANLEVEIAAAEAVLEQVEEQVGEAVDSYSTLESGKVDAAYGYASGSAQIADALAQIESGESEIESGEEELESAQESYENAREEALKSANLDSLLSLDTLSSLIEAQNFSMPAGYIYQDEDQYLLKVGDEYSSVKELKNSVLCNIDGIGDVRVKDVAAVTWIDNSGDSYAKVNGEDAVLVSVTKASTAGTATVSDLATAAIEELEEEYEGLTITPVMDQGDYIDMIVQSVLQNLLFGALLAIVVLAIFLRALRPTIIVACSIPLSVLLAIVLMYFSGITLNLISLSGLAIGIGMLVDNSIVVIENIYRYRSLGVPAPKAAIRGAREVAGAVASSTLTTICVFLPIVFTNGIVRQLMVDMALTVAYSLLASLLIALTLVPCMSSRMLNNVQPKPQILLQHVKKGYEKVLRFCLRFKPVPIAIAIVALALCAYRATNTGIIIFPSMGGEQMAVSVTADPEKTDEEVFTDADALMEQFGAVEGVTYVGMMSGSDSTDTSSTSSMLTSLGDTHTLTCYLLLDDETAKDNSGVAAALEEICASYDFEDYTVSTSNMDLSSYMSSGLTVNIYGEDTDELLTISEDIMAMVEEIEGFESITNGQEDGDATIELTIDKNKAMRCGLTVAQIYAELAEQLTTESTATTLSLQDGNYEVQIVDETDTLTVDELMDYTFEVETTDEDGETVTNKYKLSKFATMETGQSLASISRENLKTYVTVTADTGDDYNTTLLSRELEEMLAEYEAPEDVTIEIAGEYEEVAEMLQDVIFMIIVAIALVYLIMVAQFQSLLSPFIVIFTIPLAFTGGFLGLYITGEEISMIALMGFLMLAGIVVNNGIVFVDYVNQLRKRGMEKKEALVEAGKTRMRPILMTMLTTVLAMCTMVFSTDAAADMTRGMAIVEIGGLIYATLMTLFIVPVLYDLFFRRGVRTYEEEERMLSDTEEDGQAYALPAQETVSKEPPGQE